MTLKRTLETLAIGKLRNNYYTEIEIVKKYFLVILIVLFYFYRVSYMHIVLVPLLKPQ